MEVLDGPNSDCVCISGDFFCATNNSTRCRCTSANIVPGTIVLPIGLLMTGWGAQKRLFWLVPDVVSDLQWFVLSAGVK